MRRSAFLKILFFALVFLLPALQAEPPPQPQPSEAPEYPAYGEDEARSILGELVPLVEEAAGLKLESLPAVRLVDGDELAEVLIEELRPQFRSLYPAYDEEALDDLCEKQASFSVRILLGKYGFLDRTLYLLPENLPRVLRLSGIEPRLTRPILKLVIAHELAHALQDQLIGLARSSLIANFDELEAYTATIEGHAVFVQERVGKLLGMDEAVIEFSRLLAANSVPSEDPADDLISKTVALKYEQVYLGGRTFIEYHFRNGGNERVWEILKRPPVKTSMIARPETYSPEKTAALDYARLLDGLDREMGLSGFQIQNVELGQLSIRAAYAKMDERDREAVAAQIEHAQAFLAQRSKPVAIVSVSLIVLKEKEFAERYFRLLENLARANLKELEKSASLTVSGFRMEDFPGIEADRARKIYFTYTVRGITQEFSQTAVRIARGNIVLEILFNSYPLEDAVVRRIANLVFSRHDRAR